MNPTNPEKKLLRCWCHCVTGANAASTSAFGKLERSRALLVVITRLCLGGVAAEFDSAPGVVTTAAVSLDRRRDGELASLSTRSRHARSARQACAQRSARLTRSTTQCPPQAADTLMPRIMAAGHSATEPRCVSSSRHTQDPPRPTPSPPPPAATSQLRFRRTRAITTGISASSTYLQKQQQPCSARWLQSRGYSSPLRRRPRGACFPALLRHGRASPPRRRRRRLRPASPGPRLRHHAARTRLLLLPHWSRSRPSPRRTRTISSLSAVGQPASRSPPHLVS